MPRGETSKWSNKDERQYEHIKEGLQDRGTRTARAKEIAARTVNKQRREEGRTPSSSSQGTGNPRTSLDARSKDELQHREVDERRRTELDEQGRARPRHS